jgi:CheY-like chemotaxis protein
MSVTSEAPTDTGAHTEPGGAVPPVHTAPAGPPTILVVEDERPMRGLLASILSREGYGVRLAVNGAEGLDLLRQQRPDLVLLDLALQHLSGAGFRAVQTRMPPDLARIPVIVVSGAQNAEEDARRLGAVACVSKPFTPAALLQAVAAHVCTAA